MHSLRGKINICEMLSNELQVHQMSRIASQLTRLVVRVQLGIRVNFSAVGLSNFDIKLEVSNAKNPMQVSTRCWPRFFIELR